jgi:hypothetical protein
MTASTIDTLNTIAVIAGIVIPSGQIIFKNGIWYKRITLIGWALIALSIYIYVVSQLGNSVEKTEKQQAEIAAKKQRAEDRKVDSTTIVNSVNAALKPKNLAYNPHTGEVIVISTKSKPTTKPFLIIAYDNPPNPTIKDVKGEKTFFIDFKSINADARIRSYRFLVFKTQNGVIDKSPFIYDGHYVNQASIIPKDAIQGVFLFLNRTNNIEVNSYVVFEVKYADIDNKGQAAFRKVYWLNTLEIGAALPQANDIIYKEINILFSKYKY